MKSISLYQRLNSYTIQSSAKNVYFRANGELFDSTVVLPLHYILCPINYSIYTRKIRRRISRIYRIIEFADEIAIVGLSSDTATCISSLHQFHKAVLIKGSRSS